MIKVHRNLTLLEAEPELYEELDLAQALDRISQTVITPRLRLLEEDQLELLVERLLELGYLPGVSR